jgi:hypothetical protein
MLGAGLVSAGCKRTRAPEVSEVWDEQAGVEQTAALGALAPPWPPPVKGRLGSGLLTFWLQEARSPALHVRALLSIARAGAEPPTADAVAIVAEHVRFELQRRLGRDGIAVELEYGPDRIELAMHGADADLGRVLKWLGWALRPAAPLPGLIRARDRLLGQLSPPTAEDIAMSEIVARMFGREGARRRIDEARARGLSRDDLEDAWTRLVDPRRAVLLVHAGRSGDDARVELRQLGTAWHGMGRAEVDEDAVTRLHVHPQHPGVAGRLLAEPAAPIEVTELGRGEPTLVLGRVLDTPSVADRSLARLAQRLIQEEIDARLIVSGGASLFVVRTPLSRSSPERSAQSVVDELAKLADTRHPSQRLFAAAQLWLGARVVEASLRGEDWTALFAEAIDLADDDEGIASALARDATAMLEPEPDVLRTWQRRWLDPRGGEAGWLWVAAGADDKLRRRLERVTPVAPLS